MGEWDEDLGDEEKFWVWKSPRMQGQLIKLLSPVLKSIYPFMSYLSTYGLFLLSEILQMWFGNTMNMPTPY